jgi:peptide/nickel transport system substrate-binding protein
MASISRRTLIAGAAGVVCAAAVGRVTIFGHDQVGHKGRRVLIIASANDINNFDPHTNADEPTTTLLKNVYDALVKVTDDPPRIAPQLAQSWTASADGLEYVFKLDPAARFHDGTPVTADAVAYSYRRVLRLKKGNSWMLAGIVSAEGIQAVNSGTVRIRLNRPFGPLLQVLPWIWIVNPKQVEANLGADDGQSYLRNAVAGSGAFRVRRAESGNLYELQRVEHGWNQRDGNNGNTTGVIYKIVRESANQRLMVQRGDAHIAVNLANDDIASLQGRNRVQLLIRPEFRSFLFRMNTKYGPLADIELRKAIAYAVNYQGMIEIAVYARLAKGPIPEGLLGFDPSLVAHPTSLDLARQHLARSRHAAGGLQLRVAYISGYEQQRRWCLVLLDSLKQLGIDLDVRALTWPDMVASARTPQTCPDLFSMFTSVNYADPADVSFNHYHSSRNGNWSNPTYANPEVDELIERGRSELDVERRRAIYREFQQRVLADAPDLFIASDVRKIALRSSVEGFRYTPIRPGAFDFAPLSLKDSNLV